MRWITRSSTSRSLRCWPRVRLRAMHPGTRAPRRLQCRGRQREVKSRAKAHLKRNPADADVLEHHPVAHEAIDRMAKRGGPVFLEKEVANPREAVAADHGRGQPQPVIGCERHGETTDDPER